MTREQLEQAVLDVLPANTEGRLEDEDVGAVAREVVDALFEAFDMPGDLADGQVRISGQLQQPLDCALIRQGVASAGVQAEHISVCDLAQWRTAWSRDDGAHITITVPEDDAP